MNWRNYLLVILGSLLVLSAGAFFRLQERLARTEQQLIEFPARNPH